MAIASKHFSSALLTYRTWDLRLFGAVCSVDWLIVIDVSGQPIGPRLKGRIVEELDRVCPETSVCND
jgi:hypothetical protein